VIAAGRLTKSYGTTRAVDGLSFTVRPGVVTGFLGPNGSGKSTTMRMVMGLDHPDSGTVTIGGKRFHDLPWPLREVGALLEAKAIHPGRSAYNHLLAMALTNSIPTSRVDEVLGLVGLDGVSRRKAGKFSLAKSLPAGSSILTQVHSSTFPYVSLADGRALRAVPLSGAYLLLVALLACAIGFIIRHTAGAVATFVGILPVLPLIVSVLPSSVAQSFEGYLPSNLGLAMTLVTTRKTDFAGVLFSPWTATVLLITYVVATVILAGWLLVRRDA